MRRIRSRALTVLSVALFPSLLGGIALADVGVPLPTVEFPDDPEQTPVPVVDPLPVVDPPVVDPPPVDPPPVEFPDDPEHGG